MSSFLLGIVATVVADLARSGGTNTHVHFDTPEFAGAVPAFEDVAWIGLAGDVISAAARYSDRILVDVPIGDWEKPPDRQEISGLKSLNPWQPPGIYLLPEGESAFEHRKNRGWYLDQAPSVIGANGWWGGYLDNDTPGGPIWRVSLLYETTRRPKST